MSSLNNYMKRLAYLSGIKVKKESEEIEKNKKNYTNSNISYTILNNYNSKNIKQQSESNNLLIEDKTKNILKTILQRSYKGKNRKIAKSLFETTNNKTILDKDYLKFLVEQNPTEQTPRTADTENLPTPGGEDIPKAETTPQTAPRIQPDETPKAATTQTNQPQAQQPKIQLRQPLEQQQEKKQKPKFLLISNILKATRKLAGYIDFSTEVEEKINKLAEKILRDVEKEDVSKNNFSSLCILLSSYDYLQDTNLKKIIETAYKKYLFNNENIKKFANAIINKEEIEEEQEAEESPKETEKSPEETKETETEIEKIEKETEKTKIGETLI